MSGKKRQDPEKFKKSYLIETTLGNCIVAENSKSLVNIVNDCFLEKDIELLNPGDMVVYHKQGIDKTLEEVEPFLSESPRYEEARRRIHIEDEEGRRIPIFRHDLVPIAAELAGISKQVVDANLFKPNDADFNAKEYLQMREAVHIMLEDAGYQHKYAEATVHGWLTGETLAPRNWDIFDALSRQNDTFKTYNLPKEEGGLHDHYTLYIVVRQGIMRYLTTKGSRKNADEREGEEKPEKPRISLAQEINIVLSQFMEDVSDEYALARVVKIRKLDPVSRDIFVKKDKRLKLTKRVITNEPAEDYGRKISYAELVGNYVVLRHVLHMAMVEFVENNPDEPYVSYVRERAKPYKVTSIINGFFGLEHMAKCEGLNLPNLGNERKTTEYFIPQQMLSITYAKMYDGNLDLSLSLEPQQFYRCFNALLNISRNLPKDFIELRVKRILREQQSGQKVDSYDWTDDEKADAKRIQKKYGYQMYPDEHSRQSFISILMGFLGGEFDHVMIKDTEFITDFFYSSNIRKYIDRMITRAEFQSTLDKYSVGYMMRFTHPNEFLWETLVQTEQVLPRK